jgi:broad specificity phosphatase PhoE
MLWLVRHAPVELRLDEPAHTWPLTDEGLAAAEELARKLPRVARVVSSPEPKALGTAEPIAQASGVEVEVDDRLREVERAANLPTYDEHRAAVRRYLDGEEVDGWEPRDVALRRVREAVDGLDDAAFVSHGMLLSLLLGYSFEQWNRIALPDAIAWEGS